MINPNSLKQLTPNKSHWRHPKTTTIRIPENIKDKVLDYAHKLDDESVESNNCKSTETVEKIGLILSKIDNKESGYKPNSATKLINDLKTLMETTHNDNY